MNRTIRHRLASPLILACLFVYFLAGSVRSQFSPSFHDLGGGRIPTADGAAWLVSSTMATQGHRLSWPARRPLNVSFNAPLIVLADRISADPLERLLQLKRILAFMATATLVIALGGICSHLTRLGIGISLLSVLFTSKASTFTFLLGSGVGYTQGSELNAFIFIVAAVACLSLAARQSVITDRRRLRLPYLLGVLLLVAGCQMRPGTLLLVPLVIGLFAVVNQQRRQQQLHSDSQQPPRPTPNRLRPFLAATAAGLAGAFLLQQIAFAQVTDQCGAIGGNQGLTLYGLTQGLNWNAGVAFAEKKGIQCERTANRILKEQAAKDFLSDPAPALKVIVDNFDKNNNIAFTPAAKPGRRSWAIAVFVVALMLVLISARRIPGRNGPLSPSNIVLLTGIAGWLSMELFILILFRDAYMRPLTPYSVFPIITIGLILDRAIRKPANTQQPAESHEKAAVLFTSLALIATLLIGNIILFAAKDQQPSAVPSRRDMVSGQFTISLDQLHSIGTDLWMFSLGLPTNYRISQPLPAELAKEGHKLSGDYCLRYQRRRLLDSFDSYGTVSIAPSACRP